MDNSTISLLYQLFSEYSELSKTQQTQKLSLLQQSKPAIAKELASLLCHQDASVSNIISYLQGSLIEDEETDFRIGRLINNKYQITTLLGQGGMSDVYQAKRIDGLIEHTVAVKYFALAYSSNTALNMIKKEAQILANLDHQFIASFIDIGHDNHQEPNIMMEYINGMTLFEFLNSGPSEKAKRQVNQTLNTAIVHAKEQGIEHGDLSKNNVLVDTNGNANIIDFDIASYTAPKIKDTLVACD